jgi:hypothetical protein
MIRTPDTWCTRVFSAGVPEPFKSWAKAGRLLAFPAQDRRGVFYDFVNTSYMASHALHHHQKQLWDGADGSSFQASADEVTAQILALRHVQTKIRLLAPARTVDLANEIRFRVKDAVQAASPTITAERHEQNRAIIAEARAQLLGSAKKDMALPR